MNQLMALEVVMPTSLTLSRCLETGCVSFRVWN